MLHSFISLCERAIGLSIQYMGTTALALCAGLVVFGIRLWRHYRRDGWVVMSSEWRGPAGTGIVVSLAIWLGLVVFCAARIVYDDHNEMRRENAQLRRTDHITAQIEQITVAQLSAPSKYRGRAGVILVVSIRNLGTPTVLDGWDLYVTPPGHAHAFHAVFSGMPLGTVRVPTTEGGQSVLSSTDALEDKTFPNPIPSGGAVRGYLAFVVPDWTIAKFISNNVIGTSVELHFMDVAGKKYVLRDKSAILVAGPQDFVGMSRTE